MTVANPIQVDLVAAITRLIGRNDSHRLLVRKVTLTLARQALGIRGQSKFRCNPAAPVTAPDPSLVQPLPAVTDMGGVSFRRPVRMTSVGEISVQRAASARCSRINASRST